MAETTPTYADLCRWDNLYAAWRKAAKGKRGRPAAAAFEYRLEENLVDLKDELQEERYLPGVYDSFYIHDPKKRLLRRKGNQFRRRIKGLKKRYILGTGDVTQNDIENALKGWINHVRYGDTWGLRRTILEEVGIWPIYKEACPYLPRPSTS